MMKTINHKKTIIVGMIVMMLITIGALHFSRVLYVNDSKKEDTKATEKMKITVEGDIIDRNGEYILTPTEPLGKNSTEVKTEYAYIVGYNHVSLGRSGIRNQYREHLFDDNNTGKGGTVQLTIDDVLQKKAYNLLKNNGKTGAIIVMDAKNGELLAMASRRAEDLDLTALNNQRFTGMEKWKDMKSRKNLLLSPATDEPEAPGSVFKIITTCAIAENGLCDEEYNDTGLLTVGNAKIENAIKTPQGIVTAKKALSKSLNTYYGYYSMKLGERKMKDIAERFLIGTQVDVGFTVLPSAIGFNGQDSNLAMIGFGQGELAVTPLHLAMIGQSIVNNGIMLRPVLVKNLYDEKGRNIFEDQANSVLTVPVDESVALKVKELMAGVTEDNFPELPKVTGKEVYSKTGTAEIEYCVTNENTKKESWYMINHAYLLSMTDDYVVLISINDTKEHGSDLEEYVKSMFEELYI